MTPPSPRTRKARPDVHLNLKVRGMGASATVAINERCDALRAQGRLIYKLGLGQSPFPVPEVVVEALRRHAGEKDYLPVKGLRQLREAVAGYHRRTVGVDRTGDDVLVGPGSKELMFLLQLVYYGDLVIPTPAWVSYAPQARMLTRNVQPLETTAATNWKLLPETLERMCEQDPARPRIVVLNYPSNPTGGSYRPGELKALAQVAKRHKLVILSDEIYGGLHHRGEHVSIARYHPEGTIVSGGLSKWCGAGGWRLGTFLFPEGMRWLLDAMAAAASETYTSTAAPIQYAAVTAFDGGPEIEAYLQQSRRVVGALGRWAYQRLRQAGIECIEPVGGFYLFPVFTAHAEGLRARGIETGSQLCERLLDDAGVAILPGREFGRPDSELSARLAYVNFDGGKALAAAAELETLDESFLRTHCPDTTAAIDLICGWVEG